MKSYLPVSRIAAASAIAGLLVLGVVGAAYAAARNDDIDEPLSLRSLPFSISGSNDGATLNSNEPSPCGYMDATLWYELFVPSDGKVTLDTIGSEVDTVLAVYRGGGSYGSLREVDCNDDAFEEGYDSEVTFDARKGTYWVQVGGYDGEQGHFKLHGKRASSSGWGWNWGR
jgi:hypothetical protein